MTPGSGTRTETSPPRRSPGMARGTRPDLRREQCEQIVHALGGQAYEEANFTRWTETFGSELDPENDPTGERFAAILVATEGFESRFDPVGDFLAARPWEREQTGATA
jgi:hypothetical protein